MTTITTKDILAAYDQLKKVDEINLKYKQDVLKNFIKLISESSNDKELIDQLNVKGMPKVIYVALDVSREIKRVLECFCITMYSHHVNDGRILMMWDNFNLKSSAPFIPLDFPKI